MRVEPRGVRGKAARDALDLLAAQVAAQGEGEDEAEAEALVWASARVS